MDVDKTDPADGEPAEGADEKGISRKAFVAGGVAAGAAIGLGASGAALGARKAPATPKAHANNADHEAIVFIKGKIHTMDGSSRIVEQARIENGKFVEVGNNVERGQGEGDQPQGRARSLPGMIEPHVHIVSLANRPGYHQPIEDATSIAEVQALLASRRPGRPRRAVHHRARRLASEPVGRAPPADARRARRGGLRPARVHLPDLHRPVGDQQPRQGVLRERLRRRSPARWSSAPTADRERQPEPVDARALPPAGAPDVRGQEAEHARRDDTARRRSA